MQSDERTGHLIKLIHNAVGTRMNAHLKCRELTLSQIRVLRFLYTLGGKPASVRDIEQRFSVTHPTAVGLIQRLEHKGFVCVQTNKTDRRVRDITLSERGDALHDEMEREIRSTEELMLKEIGDEDREKLRTLLVKVYENITCEETSE